MLNFWELANSGLLHLRLAEPLSLLR